MSIDTIESKTMLTLQTRVSAAVMRDKAHYQPEQPFECTGLPAELEAELLRTAQQTLALIGELEALLRQHTDDFLRLLPPLADEKGNRYRHGLGTKAREGLTNIQKALSGPDHPSKLLSS